MNFLNAVYTLITPAHRDDTHRDDTHRANRLEKITWSMASFGYKGTAVSSGTVRYKMIFSIISIQDLKISTKDGSRSITS